MITFAHTPALASLIAANPGEDVVSTMLEAHYELQQVCYTLARRNEGELMEDDAWLRHAINASDMNLEAGRDQVRVWGSCYSVQTQSTEYFDFSIPLGELGL